MAENADRRVMLAVKAIPGQSYSDSGQTWHPWRRSSFLAAACPLGLAQLRVVYLCKSSLTQGGTSQKPSKVFHNNDPTRATSPTHSIADRQLPMHGNGSVCASKCFRWPRGKAVWLWYSLTMTQHCVSERHNDGCLQVALTTRLHCTTHHRYMDEGCVCLPARRLDSFSNPCLKRT